ncbi:M14 family metallopeptidase [Tenuifilum osseticum]|uniref:M14 family metallopeptidase n=1 Tax=Tenuifilum osseticum TaxID=3374723 RepID=UPI0034E59103
MKRAITLLLSFTIWILFSHAQVITSPEEHFGFTPGADRMLFKYDQVVEYLRKVETQSPMVKLTPIGQTAMGKTLYAVFVSSKENIANLDRLKEINKQLAINYSLNNAEREQMVDLGRVFVMATLSMHSTEVGPTQALPTIIYRLISGNTFSNTLNNVVYMAVICHNPDGMDMVVDYYNQFKGTKYEGGPMPFLYQKYVGHDNNRDFITLTQPETKAISRLTSQEWFPQVMVEKHQMGLTGPRYFVPPYHDPIAQNVDAELYTWSNLFGQNMLNDLTSKGLQGVSQQNLFDNYWPGSTETCLWKNVISMLTEAASARVATPVYIEPTELTGTSKGLAEYKKGVNMLLPWPGGWWHLSDIVALEVESTISMLQTASKYKERILRFRNDICKKQVSLGKTIAPYHYILPANQQDPSELVSLVNLLKEHGVNVYRLKQSITIQNQNFLSGDIVVPLAQPFRMFIKEVMEPQEFPERRLEEGGKVLEPYDITSWSLPLHKGLTCFTINNNAIDNSIIEPIQSSFTLNQKTLPEKGFALLPSTVNQSYKLAVKCLKSGVQVERTNEHTVFDGIELPAGSFCIPLNEKTRQILNDANFSIMTSDVKPNNTSISKIRRIGLLESQVQSMDAGWTKYILDTYEIPYTVINPSQVAEGNLLSKFDLIIIPNTNATLLKDGKFKRNGQVIPPVYPEIYTKGMGQKGIEALTEFIQNGGTVLAWEQATELFEGTLSLKQGNVSEEFMLPFKNNAKEVQKQGFSCPGSLVRLKIKPVYPFTFGLADELGIFMRDSYLFETQVPSLDMDRRVIGYFEGKSKLLSGYLKGEELMDGMTAAIWLRKGKGQVILLGFSPIFRASVPSNYKILFNTIL